MSESKHTPGPWRWEINLASKSLHLVGGAPKFDLTVMDFKRWGMGGSTARLRDLSEDGMNIMHKVHERPDWIAPFEGREHHADWCADITHPDMVLIASAPDLAAEVERLKSALTKISGIRDSMIGCQKVNWSEHVYPLVAALDAAGFEGASYEVARDQIGTLLERTNKAEAEVERLRASERRAYAALDKACGDVTDLRRKVEALETALRFCVPRPQSSLTSKAACSRGKKVSHW